VCFLYRGVWRSSVPLQATWPNRAKSTITKIQLGAEVIIPYLHQVLQVRLPSIYHLLDLDP
jgi:hypothetical protein